jgi:hypothetical protein
VKPQNFQSPEPAAVPAADKPLDFLPLVTRRELAIAFEEWDRRYRENPAGFMSDVQHLVNETPGSYGELCGSYLAHVLAEHRNEGTGVVIGATVMFVHAGVHHRGTVVDVTPSTRTAHVSVLGYPETIALPKSCCSPA